LAWQATARLRSGNPVVGLVLADRELACVLDDALGPPEDAQSPAFIPVYEDGSVAASEGLVAALALAGVVELAFVPIDRSSDAARR
jgi:hypothetical protein